MQKQENQHNSDSLQKRKHGGSNWSQKQPISGTITKEEEEAVETLYTLVGISSIMARLVINRVTWDSNSWPFLAVSRVTVHKKQSWKRCAAHMFT
ncbi:hypothetical protein PVL29_009270 [Vitis rotundifolia]|uniref:Uncharacterized protein n=1 Tax=Vitis rotundifolia TaxID=103349 RepID=A0AA39DV85_VITRO|nr:hypothetical protein PVL29_009270 [Vitis rotundifolia]